MNNALVLWCVWSIEDQRDHVFAFSLLGGVEVFGTDGLFAKGADQFDPHVLQLQRDDLQRQPVRRAFPFDAICHTNGKCPSILLIALRAASRISGSMSDALGERIHSK